jgi:hypothetical protein
MAPLYTNFLNQAQGLSQTPFNPAMLGQVAPMNADETAAGQQLFNLGMDMGNFDPTKVKAIESPYTEDVVNATQNWFNNQNAIQGTGLLSQAIRSGNAFGGDRPGIAEAQLAGQQQLAQAPVIAGLRQAGYTQALDEYNRLKQFGLQGAGAALGWGQMQQQQAQKELDVAQQNAMMQSAYPFQTANWYGSVLGGVGPLTGAQTLGFTTPPAPNPLSQGLGLVSAAIGAAGALAKRGGNVRNMGSRLPREGMRTGGLVDNRWRREQSGGLGPVPRRFFQDGGPVTSSSDDVSIYSLPDQDPGNVYTGYRRDDEQPRRKGDDNQDDSRDRDIPDVAGRLRLGPQRLPQPIFPPAATTTPQRDDTTAQGINLLTSGIGLATKLAPLAMLAVKHGGAIAGLQSGGSSRKTPNVPSVYQVPSIFGQLELPARSLPQPTLPPASTGQTQQDPLTQGLQALTKGLGQFKSSSSSSSSDGEPIKVGESVDVPAAGEARGGLVRFQQGGDVDDDEAEPAGLPVQAEQYEGQEHQNQQQVQANATQQQQQARTRTPVTDRNYNNLHPGFVGPLGALQGILLGRGIDTTVNEGYRDNATQDRYYAQGRSRPGPIVTGARGGQSFHNYGAAADLNLASLAPGMSREQAERAVGQAIKDHPELGLRWGGTFSNLYDPLHVQMNTNLAALRRGDAEPAIGGPSDGGPSGDRRYDAGPQLQPGQSMAIPGLEKPAPTYAQRLATNPFWQMGAGLLSGRSPWFGPNLGGAMTAMDAQQLAERNRILDEKPTMIHGPDGSISFLTRDGRLTNVFGPSAAEQRAQEEHELKMDKPFVVKGPFGDELYKRDPKTGEWIPYEPPQPKTEAPPPAPAAQPTSPPTPTIAPPPASTTPAPTAPAVRQTEAPLSRGLEADLSRPIEERIAAGERAAGTTAEQKPATPSKTTPTPTPAPTAPATGGPTLPQPAPDQIATDEQKQTAALIAARGQGFKEGPEDYLRRTKAHPKMLQAMGYTPETFDFAAMQVAHGDNSPIQNLGMGKGAGMFKSAVKARAAQYWIDQGLSADEARAAVAEFGGMKAGARSLGQQAARITGALTRATATAPLVTELSSQVNRTNFPSLNAVIIRAKQETGDTPVRRYVAAIETFKNEYALAIGGGSSVLTVHAQQQADKIIDAAFSDGQVQATVGQMLQEMQRALAGTKRGMDLYLGTSRPDQSGTTTTPPQGGGGGPQVGATQTINGVTYEFDGRGWKARR